MMGEADGLIKIRIQALLLSSLLCTVFIALVSYTPVASQSNAITLDGQFEDWLGQPNVPDGQGDAKTNHSDLSAFFFTNNPDQDMLFFMAERWDLGSEGMDLRLFLDTNNNGAITEPGDRIVAILYHPNQGGRTYVDLFDGAGGFLKQIAYQANWGEVGKGGKVEWGVTFTDLGIVPNQTIRMQLISYNGTQASDTVAEVQWSPANALGWYLLVFSGLIGLIWLYWKRRQIT